MLLGEGGSIILTHWRDVRKTHSNSFFFTQWYWPNERLQKKVNQNLAIILLRWITAGPYYCALRLCCIALGHLRNACFCYSLAVIIWGSLKYRNGPKLSGSHHPKHFFGRQVAFWYLSRSFICSLVKTAFFRIFRNQGNIHGKCQGAIHPSFFHPWSYG